MLTIKDLHKYSKNLNVLYVEDDINLRDETETLFKMLFKNIDTAEDGAAGLHKYNNNHYDLVITDVNMPNMNGIEMCIHIKEINPEQKVAIVSAHDDSDILMNLIQAGANSFILKPMHMDDLITSLYSVCRDAYTQIVNIELVNTLNEKNALLEKQNIRLRTSNNAVETKHQQLEDMIQDCKTSKEVKEENTDIKEVIVSDVPNAVIDEYFQNDEDEGSENVLFLPDHCADLSEIFTEIPEIISRNTTEPELSDIIKIATNLSKASSVLVYYAPYLDLLANSFSELATTMETNQDAFIEIMKIDPQSVLMLFDAVSADMERYIDRFSVESLAMKNIHHIHEPTALSIQQIITLLVPPPEDEGDMEFF